MKISIQRIRKYEATQAQLVATKAAIVRDKIAKYLPSGGYNINWFEVIYYAKDIILNFIEFANSQQASKIFIELPNVVSYQNTQFYFCSWSKLDGSITLGYITKSGNTFQNDFRGGTITNELIIKDHITNVRELNKALKDVKQFVSTNQLKEQFAFELALQ